MLGMKILLPIILVVGGAGFAYHKVVINRKITHHPTTNGHRSLYTTEAGLDAAAKLIWQRWQTRQQMKQQAQEFAKLTQQNGQLEKDKNDM